MSTTPVSWNWQLLQKTIAEKARELAPDYPGIATQDDPFENLWAITSSCEGAQKACDDWHRMVKVLQVKFGISDEVVKETWKESNKP